MISEHELSDLLGIERAEVTAAIAAYVQQVTSRFPQEIISITLYGSQARGEAGPESDIDLFIVVRSDTPGLREALADLAWEVQFEHDVVISDIICSLDQLHQMQTKRFPYYRGIAREGILLWKTPLESTPAYA
jgi:uncharacterized protein